MSLEFGRDKYGTIEVVFQIRRPEHKSEGNIQRRDWDIGDFADHRLSGLSGTLELSVGSNG